MSAEASPSFWANVQQRLTVEPAGTMLFFERDVVPHPATQGAFRSSGWPFGQESDWRFPETHDCRGMHAQALRDSEGRALWRVHLDQVAPQCGVLAHMAVDAPQALALVYGAAGAGLGAVAFPRSRAAGALGGLALGVLASAAASTARRRQLASK
jgi:hypothetical protein